MQALHISATRQVLSDFFPILLMVFGHSISQNQVLVLCPMALGATVLVLRWTNFVQVGVFLLPFNNCLQSYFLATY